MRNTFNIAFSVGLFMLFAYLLGCGGFARRDRGETRVKKKPVGRELSSFDFQRDYFSVPERIPEDADRELKTGQIDWMTLDSLRQINPEIDSVTTIYRVQLFASQYYSDANYEREIAEEVLERPAYLIYDVPYYKVLMGNCIDPDSGRVLLELARNFGYDNGWLVQTAPDSIYYNSLLSPDSLDPSDSVSTDSIIDTTKGY